MELLLRGFEIALTWQNLLYCLIGATVGMLVGVMPGVGPAAGTAVLIPLTFGMNPTSAVIMLAGIYYGAMYGGTVTSVLINVPGEAASVVTCLDGYQMAKQGRAGAALGISAIGSFIGGTVATLGLTFVAPPLAQFALKFGPAEYFSLMILGLSLLTSLSGGSMLRALIGTTVGLLISLVGIDPVSGATRFTFGQVGLLQGVDFIALAMGLFGIGEILFSMEQTASAQVQARIRGLLPERQEWRPALASIGRGTVIGFLIGLIPGANAAISTFASYAVERKVSKYPEKFGTGVIEGVAGPETANNAYSGASLIPLFTLGLPGSPTVAVMMGALMMHGLIPGPTLFQEQPDFVWGVIASLYIGSFMLLIMNLPMAGLWARLATVPQWIMYPFILVVTVVGTYSINSSFWDVGIMLAAGVLGYVMKKLDFPMAGMVLALVLGPQIERSLVRSLAMSQSSMAIFIEKPISAVFLAIAAVVVVSNVIAAARSKTPRISTDGQI